MAFQFCYLSEWLKKEPGTLLLEMERDQLRRALSPINGNYLVQIGGLPELSDSSPVRFKYFLNVKANFGAIQTALDELPLRPRSVDVILIIHILEFMPKPLLFLREVYQALAPGGQLIVINLNPWSLWGLKHGFTHDHELPWRGHFWSVSQIKHWVRSLRLRLVNVDTFCFRPPLKKAKWWRRLLWLEALGPLCFPAWGGFLLLVAQKRGAGMTLLSQGAWKKVSVVRRHSLKPTTRISTK